MAPEQAVSDPGIDYRVDLYALGVVAYELSGRTPFAGMDTTKMIAAMLTRPAPSLASILPLPLSKRWLHRSSRRIRRRGRSPPPVCVMRAILAEVTTSPSASPPAGAGAAP